MTKVFKRIKYLLLLWKIGSLEDYLTTYKHPAGGKILMCEFPCCHRSDNPHGRNLIKSQTGWKIENWDQFTARHRYTGMCVISSAGRTFFSHLNSIFILKTWYWPFPYRYTIQVSSLSMWFYITSWYSCLKNLKLGVAH